MTDSIHERLYGRATRVGDCWLWSWGMDRDGYGLMRYNYIMYRTHRLSWELANAREVPAGMMVCHTCDTSACINPAHLFLGSAADNHADMTKKGRGVEGVKHYMAVHTEKRIKEIRSLRGRVSRKAVAFIYGVSAASIGDIWMGRAWKHVQ